MNMKITSITFTETEVLNLVDSKPILSSDKFKNQQESISILYWTGSQLGD